ncbi:MAG: methyltransferase domain-containing protein [bacterium]|nr:methyltransferase domain-containing protein [bacterium]
MAVNTKIYDKQFFNNTIELESQSAQAMVKTLIKHFKPKSVVDIGCGAGIYLAEFKKFNIKILGFDGSPAAIIASPVGNMIKLHDLCQPLKLNCQFDLCLCLEVAEHLEKTCADILVDTLIGLSKTMVFTAATPGQGPISIGHVNEQPPEYWLKLFKRRNFLINKILTEKIKREMIDQNVIWWLTKNLMIFKKHSPR